MDIQKVAVEKLIAAKYNPRKDLQPGDPEFEKLRRSIEQFGYVEPLIWNKRTGVVVGGHQRLKVMKYLGEKEVDCVVVDLDEQNEKALNVALNKISGDWDMPMLSDLLSDLNNNGFDVTLTGFDFNEISDYFKDEIESKVHDDDFDIDEVEKNIKVPISKQGDIWQLGKHRIMCGDSVKSEMINKLMNGVKANLLITDPPYNVSYKGNAGTIKNDNMEDKNFREFLRSAFKNAIDNMECGASFYIWHADSEGYNFRGACHDVGLQVRQCLIWKKSSLVMGRQDYQWIHEPCLYGWKDGASHYWGSDRKQTTVLDFQKPRKSELHPTMKPIELFAYQILNSSKINDVVLDLFLGSGTSIISSEQTGRICYGMEYDEKYADVIVKRFGDSFGYDDIFLLRNADKIAYNDIGKQL